MRTGFAVCLALAAWVAVAVPARAADGAAPLTVVLRISKDTPYDKAARVLKALAATKVGRIELEAAGQQQSGVSAVVRAREDTPYDAVVKVITALQATGVRKATWGTKP